MGTLAIVEVLAGMTRRFLGNKPPARETGRYTGAATCAAETFRDEVQAALVEAKIRDLARKHL